MAQVEFREGWKEIPDYLARLMTGIETYKMTYEQARDAANNKMINDQVSRQVNNMLQNHFRTGGRG